MARVIEFDAEQLIGRLNILQASQFTYAGTRALNNFGFAARTHHSQEMARRFRNPVPYTLGSTFVEKGNLQVRLYLNPDGPKGNAPAEYIRPTDAGSGSSQAYLSRFARSLSKNGVTNRFPVPFKEGRGVLLNDYGNIPGYVYREIARKFREGSTEYFSVPDERKPRVSTTLKPGIYKRTSAGFDMFFGYLPTPPNVQKHYDFFGITRAYAQATLPRLLSEELDRALR